jgi:hypothetical protein
MTALAADLLKRAKLVGRGGHFQSAHNIGNNRNSLGQILYMEGSHIVVLVLLKHQHTKSVQSRCLIYGGATVVLAPAVHEASKERVEEF